MSGIAKNISIVVIVVGIAIMVAGIAILVIIRAPGTVVRSFDSVCASGKTKSCDVTIVPNDLYHQSKEVCFLVWGVEQMGQTFKVHNDVNPLCTTPASSLDPGLPRIAQLDPAKNPGRYICHTISVPRKNWYPQILTYDPQPVTLAPDNTSANLQQSGHSYSSIKELTARPTSKDYASKVWNATLSSGLSYRNEDKAKFRITGYDTKTRLWSLDDKTCTYLGLDKGTGILIEPACVNSTPLARISVSSNGKKWYLTAGYFEALPSVYSSGYSSIVFWSSKSCQPESIHCQYWQIVESSSVASFDLSHETLTTNTGSTVGTANWDNWLESIQKGDGPSSVSTVGMIDLTRYYLAPYATDNPN